MSWSLGFLFSIKMSKNLILTSGASQLLTQIATLRLKKFNLETFDVVYIGVEISRLEIVLKIICQSFGLNFVGSIPNNENPSPHFSRTVLTLSFLKHLLFASKRIKDDINLRFPLLKKYKNKIVVIPLRHKMKGDVTLLHFLKPKVTLLTADGVVNIPLKRDFSNIEWWQVRTPLNKLPVNSKVYSPVYLQEETLKIGEYARVPQHILYDIFETARNGFINVGMENDVNFKLVRAILFSQHLAISRFCSLEEEIDFYELIVKDLLSRNINSILIKTHPRDDVNKINLLKERMKFFQSSILISSESQTAIPVELYNITDFTTHLVTLNSSAPLTMKYLNTKLLCYSSPIFPKEFIGQIKDFALANNAEFLEVRS